MLRRLRRHDDVTLGLFDAAGRNVEQSTVLLRDLLRDPLDNAGLAGELVRCEHEGDRLTHDIIHRLNGGGRRPRVPFGIGDGHGLATALDDVVDHAEQAADTLTIYGVEAPMEQADALADVLVGAGEQVARAVALLGRGAGMGPHLVEIHRLENEGDRLSRDGVASLFASGIDPMVVIRWKDVFALLEAAIDACESVAHVLEGISLKQRR